MMRTRDEIFARMCISHLSPCTQMGTFPLSNMFQNRIKFQLIFLFVVVDYAHFRFIHYTCI
jgi:hypothetical protein